LLLQRYRHHGQIVRHVVYEIAKLFGMGLAVELAGGALRFPCRNLRFHRVMLLNRTGMQQPRGGTKYGSEH